MATTNPGDLLQYADGREIVKIGGYTLPAEDFSLTRFMLEDLGMSWLHPGGLPSTQRMLESLDLTEDDALLDLGCGVGSSSRYVAKRYGCRVIGVDRDPSMVAEARKRTPGKATRVRFELMDGCEMTFDSDLFDRVIMQSVVCFNDKLPLLEEAVRVLRPGGRIGLNEVTWMRPPTEKVAKVTRATVCETFRGALLRDEWVELLRRAGCDQVHDQSFGFEPVAAYQLLREEGLLNTARTFSRVLTNPDNLMRLSAVSDYFRRFPGYFGYGIYTGCKPEKD
jgi:SAM-dependent methyltransferase